MTLIRGGRAFACVVAILFASLLPAQTPRYRFAAGSVIRFETTPEARAFLNSAAVKEVSVAGPADRGIVLLPTDDGGFGLAASLTAPPGAYEVIVTAVSPEGERRSYAIRADLDPPKPVPQDAKRPPVILCSRNRPIFLTS